MSDVAKIGVLPGDGIGPEICVEAVRVLTWVLDRAAQDFALTEGLLGGCAVERTGRALPEATLELCHDSDALLVGAVGGPQWDHLPDETNPGTGGLLRLRRELGLFANIRPGRVILPELSPLRRSVVDLVIVRESVGGIYFSPDRGRRCEGDVVRAWDVMAYDEQQIERIAHVGFRTAAARSSRLASVDKANVLECSRLWREVVDRVSLEYPTVQVDHLYVDNCALQLVKHPEQFDVIVTENLFGDVLSDLVAGVVGSLGLMPSGTIRDDSFGLYEPVHGSAPDLAGKGTANPIATILSGAMLLRHSLGLESEAHQIETAVEVALRGGALTADLAAPGQAVSTQEVGDRVMQALVETC